MKKKYKMSYTLFADNETEAYDELDSVILHSGSSAFSISEEPLELWEIKALEDEADKLAIIIDLITGDNNDNL